MAPRNGQDHARTRNGVLRQDHLDLLAGSAGGSTGRAGNGHVWIKLANPLDIERARTALMVQAAASGMTWTKPRYSRAEPRKVVGKSLATILDPSVWTPGRLIFIGKPVVGEGLTVAPPSVVVHQGESDTPDTAAIVLPDAASVRQITRQAGIQMDVQTRGDGLRITAQDLTLDTEVDTEDHGRMTVRELVVNGVTGKVRCQTPFRESSSFAAFLSFGGDGKPFIYDVGTGITHWLNEFEVEELTRLKASGVDKRSGIDLPATCAPTTLPHDDEVIAKLVAMKPLEYERARNEIAGQLSCRTAVLDELVKAARQLDGPSGNLPFPGSRPESRSR